jgi:hypothetical protein
MNKEQRTVAIGAASGILGMIVLVTALSMVLPKPEGMETLAARLAFALQLNVLAALPLFIMFITVANSRFLSEAIDPLAQKETVAQITNGRVLDNTLQQNFVFLVATLALATVLEEKFQVVAAAAIVFVLARFVFWYGYRKHPLLRAPGMSATAYLNLGLMAFVIYRAFF